MLGKRDGGADSAPRPGVATEAGDALLATVGRAEQVAELVPSWSMAPVIAAYQALRGVAFLSAATVAASSAAAPRVMSGIGSSWAGIWGDRAGCR